MQNQGARPRYDYIRVPTEIYKESFRQIRAETKALSSMPGDIAELAVRIVHACGEPVIADDLVWSSDIALKGRQALIAGATIIVDCQMVGVGIIQSRLPADNKILCPLTDKRSYQIAKNIQNTRSAAAVELWRDHLEGAVVVIGNAPTALFHLLEILYDGAPHPAAILGFPVGFVGAAESKHALIESKGLGIPFITLRGRKGGSATAAAALNALAKDNEGS